MNIECLKYVVNLEELPELPLYQSRIFNKYTLHLNSLWLGVNRSCRCDVNPTAGVQLVAQLTGFHVDVRSNPTGGKYKLLIIYTIYIGLYLKI